MDNSVSILRKSQYQAILLLIVEETTISYKPQIKWA